MSKSIDIDRAQQSDESGDERRQLQRVLILAIAQLEFATRESDVSMARLSETFSRMVGSASDLETATANPSSQDQAERWREQLRFSAQQISHDIEAAIVAFQFYDRLCQRLQHVSSSCEALRGWLGNRSAIDRPDDWDVLLLEIRSKYSMQEEYDIFDAVMQGRGDRAAIEEQLQRQQSPQPDDVEMF